MMNLSIVSVLQPDEPIDRGKEIRSSHIYNKIVASMEVDIETDGHSRTELDSRKRDLYTHTDKVEPSY